VTVTIHWFRKDLRVGDNAALSSARCGARAVIPVYIHDDRPGANRAGIASRAWLSRSLVALDASLRKGGSALIIRTGAPGETLAALAQEVAAGRVCCQRDWSQIGLAQEAEVRAELDSKGIELDVSGGQLLVEPDAIATAQGKPYRVFTPYWRAWRRSWVEGEPLPPAGVPALPLMPSTAGPLSPPRGGPDIDRWWNAGEAAASERLKAFVSGSLPSYITSRERPDLRGTSEMSVRLAWGEVSPLQVASEALSADAAAEPFLRQLAWREFSHHLLRHFPNTVDEPLRDEFRAFPWRDDPGGFDAWGHGQTGFPLVDAGMRQMLETGWMHNRVRMVCASFLVKDLLVPWQEGERFFAERLADYDVAVNVFNWQWVAGCGADASPFFRVFNPVLQGEKFDTGGAYVRTWVPELSGLPSKWIHRPWAAPASELERAGVRLGANYPKPIVDHAQARRRALAAFDAVKAARRLRS